MSRDRERQDVDGLRRDIDDWLTRATALHTGGYCARCGGRLVSVGEVLVWEGRQCLRCRRAERRFGRAGVMALALGSAVARDPLSWFVWGWVALMLVGAGFLALLLLAPGCSLDTSPQDAPEAAAARRIFPRAGRVSLVDAAALEADAGDVVDAAALEADAGDVDAAVLEVDAGDVDAAVLEVDAGDVDAAEPEVDAGDCACAVYCCNWGCSVFPCLED